MLSVELSISMHECVGICVSACVCEKVRQRGPLAMCSLRRCKLLLVTAPFKPQRGRPIGWGGTNDY